VALLVLQAALCCLKHSVLTLVLSFSEGRH